MEVREIVVYLVIGIMAYFSHAPARKEPEAIPSMVPVSSKASHSEDFIGLNTMTEIATQSKASLRATSTTIPWLSSPASASNLFLQLHEEILDFVTFISPTKEEKEIRFRVISEMEIVVEELWGDASIATFGSTRTELYLPSSDIDMVVFGAPQGSKALYQLAEYLEEEGIGRSIEVIATARVPIVKFTHQSSGFNVDISFNVPGGLDTAKLIKSYLSSYPGFRPLVLVLKYYLTQRKLNDTYSGGVGSFLLQMMLVAYLQFYAKEHDRDYVYCNMLNLGHLLVGFFEFYGIQFNYTQLSISVRHGGEITPKRTRDEVRPFLLSIFNPHDPNHDVGKNSYNIRLVKRSFEYAYNTLTSEFILRANTPPTSPSILASTIILLDDTLLTRQGPQVCGYPPIQFDKPDTKASRKKAKRQRR